MGQRPATVVVAAREPNTPVVVIDLDHTLVDAPFWRVLVGMGGPMAGSVEVVRRLGEEYQVLYLTHRPDIMTQRSKEWLVEHGYPVAPMRVSTISQAIGGSGRYKAAALAELMEEFKRVEIGIGDKLSDAEAYVQNGMTAYLIPHYDAGDAGEVLEMAEAIRELGQRVEDMEAQLQVVDGWAEVEAGIFEGERFEAGAFSGELERLGRSLTQREEDDD